MKTKEKSQETTIRIIEAALGVFSEVGFNGARVDEIAKRARVNKATLYYHIGDKKALYRTTLHHVIGHTAEHIEASLRAIQSPEEKLRAYIEGFVRAIERNPQMAPIMMRELASGGRNFPAEIVQDFARIIGIVSKILDEGRMKGIFIQATPFIVHMMVAGAIVLFRATGPIRAQLPGIPEEIRNLDMNISRTIQTEIEQLVLNAISKKA